MASVRWLVVSMLLALVFPAGAGVGCPAPGIGDGGVSHQQTPEKKPGADEEDDEEEEDEEEEPDCD